MNVRAGARRSSAVHLAGRTTTWGGRGPIVIASIVLAAATLTPAAAQGKAGGTDRPVKGTLSASGVSTPGPGVLNGVFTGSGHISHMGRVTLVAENTHTLATNTVVGTSTLTVANGDTLTSTASGVIVPTLNPVIFDFRLTSTVTEGTGRFAGSSGTSTAVGTTVILFVDPTTGVIHSRSEQVISGTASY